MKTRLALLALVALPAIVLAGDTSLKSQIEALNRPVCAALLKKDVATFEKLLAPTVAKDFKYQEPGGKPMGFKEMVAGMKMGMAAYTKVTKASVKVIAVKQSGNTATAIEQHTMEGLMSGPDKKSHKMVFVGTSNETYKKVGGKWLLTNMTMKADKMTRDGKPMSMGN